MKDQIQEVTDGVEALMKLSDKFDRGHLIEWAAIEAIAGDRTTNRSRHIIGKWRRRLKRDRNIITLCADTIGVRLLTHRETATEIPQLRQRKAYRQVRRALSETATVNAAQLTVAERKMLAAQRANMAEQRLQLHRSRKELRTGLVRTEGNPRRKVTAT